MNPPHTLDELSRAQVALLAEPSVEFALGMFGSWAAGLGVLPLPVGFPDARLREMLADCAPRKLLTSRSLAQRARWLVQELADRADVLVLEDILEAPPASTPAPASPRSAAFTVYTSGSTGRPKGVLIRQDQLSPLLAWSERTWKLGSWVRMAQTLSLGFDFGLQELFTALPFGGCLVVPTAQDRADARRYARFLRRERVTVLFTTPSFANELIAAGEPIPDLRLVLLGGEVLGGATVSGLRALVNTDCRIFNGYGPTEATVNCLMHEIDTASTTEHLPDVVPAGHATAASRIRLVDEEDRPVPVGALGQILIGGPGVAEGYLHRPELTAEKFVSDPVVPDGGGTVYRSGDLAYATRDGGFVVLGRDDRQVKLRGFRAELGEIEHALRAAPGVSDATVRVLGTPGRLVAFLTGDETDPQAVRAHVAERLPLAMLPDQWVTLEGMPATANGKLDESKLKKVADYTYTPVVAATASTAQIESAVCSVWASALNVSSVSPDVNVFDLGAHSLVVTQVHARLQSALDVEFPVQEIFDHPRPQELASLLSSALAHSDDAEQRNTSSTINQG